MLEAADAESTYPCELVEKIALLLSHLTSGYAGSSKGGEQRAKALKCLFSPLANHLHHCCQQSSRMPTRNQCITSLCTTLSNLTDKLVVESTSTPLGVFCAEQFIFDLGDSFDSVASARVSVMSFIRNILEAASPDWIRQQIVVGPERRFLQMIRFAISGALKIREFASESLSIICNKAEADVVSEVIDTTAFVVLLKNLLKDMSRAPEGSDVIVAAQLCVSKVLCVATTSHLESLLVSNGSVSHVVSVLVPIILVATPNDADLHLVRLALCAILRVHTHYPDTNLWENALLKNKSWIEALTCWAEMSDVGQQNDNDIVDIIKQCAQNLKYMCV